MKLVWKETKLNDTPVVNKSPQICKERAFPAALKKKGSLTIEAALSLPIFLFFAIAVFYFLMIIFLQSDIQLHMEETARSMGKQAYLLERLDGLTINEEEIDAETKGLLAAGFNPLVIKTSILKKDLSNKIDSSRIAGGSGGFYTYHSNYDEEEGILDIVTHYNYRIPFLPGNMGQVKLSQRCRSHVWVGRELRKQAGGKEADQKEVKTVYVTEYGTVYHLSEDCHYLDLSIHSVSAGDIAGARNANGGKYYPCSCAKHTLSGSYYVTDYGTNYHADLSCSGLKRTIREVDISEVGNLHACPKCGGSH